MATKGEETEKREQAILDEIIRYYMDRQEAISARTLSKISSLALSPTTIRNLMEDLSAEGYLTTEGVARGRIPTQKAFTIFVTRLGVPSPPPQDERPEIPPMEEGRPPLLPAVLDQVGNYLAAHTGCVALTSLPPRDLYPLDWVRFSAMPQGQVLVTLQTRFGDLWSKMLVSPDPFPEDLLREVSRFINETYRNRPLEDIRGDIMAGEPKELLAEMPSLGAAFRMLRKAFEWADLPQNRIFGQENLYRIPECQGSERLALVHQALHDDEFMHRTLSQGRVVGPGRIAIGTETGYAGLDRCALVGVPFTWRDWQGIVGVLGPMRMDYGLVLSLAAQAATAVSRHLAQATEDIAASGRPT